MLTQKDTVNRVKTVNPREFSDSRANQLLIRARRLCEMRRKVGATTFVRAVKTPVGFGEIVQIAFHFFEAS